MRRTLIGVIAPEMSNFAVFGHYLENYNKENTIACWNDQQMKFYKSALWVKDEQQTLIGVIAPEISNSAVFEFSRNL